MSRRGNKILTIPANVTVTINKNNVQVNGPLGNLTVNYPHKLISVINENNTIKVTRVDDEKQTKMHHGTVNSNIENALIGVSQGFKKQLKIVGVGYKAAVKGDKVDLSLGYSHPLLLDIPEGIRVVCPTPLQIDITGADKTVVGQFAAVIRSYREPEPYNGKGVMYIDEHIVRKVGKTAEGAKK